MGDLLQPTHLIVIGIVLIVLFGGRKLPELGKGLGEGLRGFREGLKGEQAQPSAQAQNTSQQNAAPQAPTAETKQS